MDLYGSIYGSICNIHQYPLCVDDLHDTFEHGTFPLPFRVISSWRASSRNMSHVVTASHVGFPTHIALRSLRRWGAEMSHAFGSSAVKRAPQKNQFSDPACRCWLECFGEVTEVWLFHIVLYCFILFHNYSCFLMFMFYVNYISYMSSIYLEHCERAYCPVPRSYPT